MTTLYLLNCPDASGTVTGGTPNCATGTWVQVDASSLSFDLATWLETPENAEMFAAFFGAGFTIVALGFISGWGVRTLLSLLK